MKKRLKLADIDRLIEVLDNSRLGPPPRAEIDTLHHTYTTARRFEDRARKIYSGAFVALTIAWLVSAFSNSTLLAPTWFTPTILVIMAVHLLAITTLTYWLPVLMRRERVLYLLEYYEADLTFDDQVYGRKTAPLSVLTAIATLEQAKEPAELGPAYGVVESWSNKAHGLDFDGAYLTFLWLVGLLIAISGAQVGVTDFWRGIAGGVVLVLAIQYFLRTQEGHGVRRRAESALGRWRHLVTKMRELPQ